MIIEARAPGSVMLFGEHAVLHEALAIVMAANVHLTVTLTPRTDQNIEIHSALGHYQASLEALPDAPPFRFVLACIQSLKSCFPCGLELTITSEFSHTVGLGSSAAITVATLAALLTWLETPWERTQLFRLAKTVIQSVQGLGSGADAAAAVFGGVNAYRMKPAEITPLPMIPQLHLVYSGSKTPTAEVVQFVTQSMQQDPERYQAYFKAIDRCSQQAITCIQHSDWQQLGVVMQAQQDIMQTMQLSTPMIDTLITQASNHPNILGAKISGSGLGDCIVCLGDLPKQTFPTDAHQAAAGIQQFDLHTDTQGIYVTRT